MPLYLAILATLLTATLFALLDQDSYIWWAAGTIATLAGVAGFIYIAVEALT